MEHYKMPNNSTVSNFVTKNDYQVVNILLTKI